VFDVSTFAVLLLVVFIVLLLSAIRGLASDLEELRRRVSTTPESESAPSENANEASKVENAFESYREERVLLEEHYHSSCENHVKAIVTLSASALALSITFLHSIATKRLHLELIVLAWISFSSCLLLISVANHKTKASFWRGIEILDKAFIQNKLEDNEFTGQSDKLERRAEIMFWVGVALFGWFSVVNLGGNDLMTENKQVRITSDDYEKKSGPTPIPPNILRPATTTSTSGSSGNTGSNQSVGGTQTTTDTGTSEGKKQD